MGRLRGEVGLVAGGGAGLGHAIVQKFIDEPAVGMNAIAPGYIPTGLQGIEALQQGGQATAPGAEKFPMGRDVHGRRLCVDVRIPRVR